jgi:protein-S-isoprenylcysteine O-methyltransferase Ste14
MSISSGQLIRAIVGFTLYLLLTPILLFLAAGTLAWPAAWVYISLGLCTSLGSRLVVFLRNPDTLLERARFSEAEGTPGWDRALVPLVGIGIPALSVVIAGLDFRYSWTPELSQTLQVIGGILITLGYAAGVWAMIANRFFSAVVRIQSDRDQYVVQSGPYRIVRHPSYAGALLAGIGMPLLLSSAWVVIPVALMFVVLVLRTRFEDDMLLQELAGYREYAARTRFRLMPGVW